MNFPYERNPFFTGRDDLLKRLNTTLRTSRTPALMRPLAISGLGGIGKTQTAVEYAYQYQRDYTFILWVKAESRETLISEFVTLARLLDLPEKQEQEQHRVVEAVKNWFNGNTGWLFIFDNADDLTMVRDFLPSGDKGHILLTTRTHATGRIAQRIEVESMNPEEGALFLLRRATILKSDTSLDNVSESDRLKAREIVHLMDGLPLALDQAGAFIEETQCGLSDYLQLYTTRKADLLNRRGRLIADHPDSVATTWSLSFEKVEHANPAAADLLRLCAFLDSDAIPEEVITKGAPELGPILQSVATEPMKLNEAIGDLLNYSLLKRHPNNHTLTIHPLFQDILKHNMNKSTQQSWAEWSVRAVNRAFPEVAYTNWLSCQHYIPHILVCLTLIEQWDMAFPEAAQLLTGAGTYLKESAQFAKAETLCLRALAIREKVLGPEHADTASSLNNLAVLFEAQGQYAKAETFCQRALAIREKVLGLEHPDTAQTLDNLGTLYRTQGQYAKAETFCQRALAIREKVLGPEDTDTASSFNNLGTLYRTQGQYAKAEPLYQRALAIREKVLGSEHPDTAQSLDHLAWLYRAKKDYQKAELLSQRALAIREKVEKVLGPELPDTAQTLNVLGGLYYFQGQYAKAEPLYQRALAIREKVLGPEHADTASSLNNLAVLFEAQGQYAKAEPLYRRALAIREKVLGPEHADTGTSFNNLAVFYKDQGQYTKAEQLYQRALAIYEKVLEPEHPDTARTLNNLGLLYQNQSQYAKAEQLYQRALAIYEKALGPEHPDTAQSLNDLGLVYYNQSQYAKAEPLYQRALAIYEKVLEPEHSDTARALDNLAVLYHNQFQYAKAESLYQRALAIYEKVLEPEHSDTARTLNNLGLLYQAQLQYAKAEPLYQRALAIREMGSEHLETARILDNLAVLYDIQGQYEQAEPLYLRVLAIRQKELEPRHFDTIQTFDNLARLYVRALNSDQMKPLETVITVKGKEFDALALVHQQLAESEVFVLGSPAGDTSIAGRGTESMLLHFTVNDINGKEQDMLPIFTRTNIMKLARLRNPEWQSVSILQVDGRALLENIDHDVTVVINPWSPLEFQLPRQQDKVREIRDSFQDILGSDQLKLLETVSSEKGNEPDAGASSAAELEAFITMNGDNLAHDDAVRRCVVKTQVLALGAPAAAGGLAHLLHCTVSVGDTTIAMLPVFTRIEHVITAVQMNPAWQSLSVLQMDGSVVLGDLEEGECLGIDPWSGHEFKLPSNIH